MTKKQPVKKSVKSAQKGPVRARAAAPKARATMAGQAPERRHVFRGNAAAFGGQIYRPEHIPMGASGSCLSVTGGVSQSNTGRLDFANGFITIGSASTTAEGGIDNLERAKAWTDRPNGIREDSLPTSTRAGAQLNDLVVRRNRTLELKAAGATLEAHSPRNGSEPGITVTRPLLSGLSVDGFGITVEFNTTFFQRHDTKSKVLEAAAAFRKAAPQMPGLFERNRVVYGTIVRAMTWTGGKPTNAEIVGNTIVIGDLGTFYIGEILIGDTSWRLTMIRGELGSPDGGGMCGIDIDINGTWAP